MGGVSRFGLERQGRRGDGREREDTFGAVGIVGGDAAGWGEVKGTGFAEGVGSFFFRGGLVFAGCGFGLWDWISKGTSSIRTLSPLLKAP